MVCLYRRFFTPPLDEERLRLISIMTLEAFIREDNENRVLAAIEDAWRAAENPKKKRLYLERGLELTGVSAEQLSANAEILGFPGLAEAYRTYSQGEEK